MILGPDGKPVAVEPIATCGDAFACYVCKLDAGHGGRCRDGFTTWDAEQKANFAAKWSAYDWSVYGGLANRPQTDEEHEQMVLGTAMTRPAKGPDPELFEAYRRLARKEIDAHLDNMIAGMKLMDEGPQPPPAPLTRRQRLGLAWWRLRRSVARAVLRVAELISPGVAGEDCDC